MRCGMWVCVERKKKGRAQRIFMIGTSHLGDGEQ